MSRTFLCVTLLMLSTLCVRAADIEGVRVEDQVMAGGQTLVLNGAGVRHKLMFAKMYVGALYLRAKTSSAEAVLTDTGAKRVALFVLAEELSARELIASINNSLSVNLSKQDLAQIESRLTQLNQMMMKVGALKKGGVVTLTYVPATGTHIRVNSEELLVVKGEDFFNALMHIWIGDKPVDGRLKSSLLGDAGSFRLF